MNLLDYIFLILTFIWYILYALTFTTFNDINIVFNYFAFYYQIYVCLLLIFYFNPYGNVKLTQVKRQMIFSAALMLLFSMGLKNIYYKINYHFSLIKKNI